MSGFLSRCCVVPSGSVELYENTTNNPASVTLNVQTVCQTADSLISVNVSNTEVAIQECSTAFSGLVDQEDAVGLLVDTTNSAFHGQLYKCCYMSNGPNLCTDEGNACINGVMSTCLCPPSNSQCACTGWPANNWPTCLPDQMRKCNNCCVGISAVCYGSQFKMWRWGTPLHSFAPTGIAFHKNIYCSSGSITVPAFTSTDSTPCCGIPGLFSYSLACSSSYSNFFNDDPTCYYKMTVEGICCSSSVFACASDADTIVRRTVDIWSDTPLMVGIAVFASACSQFSVVGTKKEIREASVNAENNFDFRVTCANIVSQLSGTGRCPYYYNVQNLSGGCTALMHPAIYAKAAHAVCHGFLIQTSVFNPETTSYHLFSSHPDVIGSEYTCGICKGSLACCFMMQAGICCCSLPVSGAGSTELNCTGQAKVMEAGYIMWSVYDAYCDRNVLMVKACNSSRSGFYEWNPALVENINQGCTCKSYCFDIEDEENGFTRLATLGACDNLYTCDFNQGTSLYQLMTPPINIADQCWVSYVQCYINNTINCWNGCMVKFVSQDLTSWCCAPEDEYPNSFFCLSTGSRNKFEAAVSSNTISAVCDHFFNTSCLDESGIVEFKTTANNLERTGLVIGPGEKLFVADESGNKTSAQVWGYDE